MSTRPMSERYFHPTLGRSGRAAALVSILSLLFLLIAPAVRAQASVTVATAYPGVAARPGETVTFPLKVVNHGSSGQSVSLELAGVPKGWDPQLTGDGRQVFRVYAGPGEEQDVDLRVRVPDDAKTGDYRFSVLARGTGFSDRLDLSIRVSTTDTGADRLETQYPSLTGPSDATFKFRVDLTNSSSHDRSYSLGAQAPEGWQVTFSPAYDSKQIASLSLKAGETQGLDVDIKPPPNVPAGQYKIVVQATSASTQPTRELEVNIMGSFKLNLSTPSGRLNASARAGRETTLTLVVENSGSAEVPRVTLSSSTPSGWTVRFQPDRLESLPPGEKREVTAYIRPDARAIAGDYDVTVNASAPAVWDSADIRVTVETPTVLGVVGTLIVVLVVAGVGWVFHKYGRR